MQFIEILRAEYKLVYAEMFRRKSMLVMMFLYPYVLTSFTLFIGYSFGSKQVFVERTGVAPEIFMITASFIILSMLTSIDDMIWKPLMDLWHGTLPYIIASPVSRIMLYAAIPIPRLTAVVIVGSTSIIPVYALYYGLRGLLTSLIVISLACLGAVFMITPAMVVTGLVNTVGESWRVINIIRPIFMILLGAYYPRILMPLAGLIASYALPPSHIVELIQAFLRNAASALNTLSLMGIATALFVIYAPGGSRSILLWEKKKVKEGVKYD